jgi:hypothetical protein
MKGSEIERRLVMIRWKTFIILIAAAALVCLSSPVSAQLQAPTGGKIKAGPVEIHPSIGLMETYSDNIYQSYDGKDDESDYITTVSPGIQFVLPFRRHSLQVGYKGDYNFYADNDDTDYHSHLFGGALNLDFPGGLVFTVSDYYSISSTPRKWKEQDGLSGANDPYREEDYDANDLNVKARYNFADRWAAAAWYNNHNLEYDEDYDDSGSYNRNLGGGSLFYRFTAKTEALIEYNYSTVDYDKEDTDDNDNQMAYVGLSFDPTAKLNGYLKVGWAQKEYDEKVAGRDEKYDRFSSRVDLGYIISSYNQLGLKYDRVIEEDADTNSPFTKDDVSLSFRHILSWNEKISLNARAGYASLEYETADTDVDGTSKKRDDEKWYGGVGIGYDMQQWLSFKLDYTYTDNDSNFKRYDYTENRISLSGVVYF